MADKLREWYSLGDVCRDLAEDRGVDLEHLDPERLNDQELNLTELDRFRNDCDRGLGEWTCTYGRGQDISFAYLSKGDAPKKSAEALLIQDDQRRILVEVRNRNIFVPTMTIHDSKVERARELLAEGSLLGVARDIVPGVELHSGPADNGYHHVRECLSYFLD